jgi:hypothetical protein
VVGQITIGIREVALVGFIAHLRIVEQINIGIREVALVLIPIVVEMVLMEVEEKPVKSGKVVVVRVGIGILVLVLVKQIVLNQRRVAAQEHIGAILPVPVYLIVVHPLKDVLILTIGTIVLVIADPMKTMEVVLNQLAVVVVGFIGSHMIVLVSQFHLASLHRMVA